MAFGDRKGDLTGGAKSITNPFSATTARGSLSVSIGDLIYCTLTQETALTVTSVTDNLHTPATYTAVNAGTDAGTVSGRSFYIVATVAGTLTSVDATCTASANNVGFIAALFTGPFAVTASVKDVVVANTSGTTSSSPFSCPATGVLAQASEVVISQWNANPETSLPVGQGAAVAIDAGNVETSTTQTTIIYQTVSSTSSVTQSFTFTGTTTGWVAGTASFKAAAEAVTWFMKEFRDPDWRTSIIVGY